MYIKLEFEYSEIVVINQSVHGQLIQHREENKLSMFKMKVVNA